MDTWHDYSHQCFLADAIRERTRQLEVELAECKKLLTEKLEELAAKDNIIDDLKLKLKAQEKGFKDKVTHLNQLVIQYKRQAEESASQNADLLLQSHRDHAVRLSSDYQPLRPSSNQHSSVTRSESQVPTNSSSNVHGAVQRSRSSKKIRSDIVPHAPEEPKDGRPSSRHRVRVKAAMIEITDPSLQTPDPIHVRAASGRRLLQDDPVVPDPKPFLKLSRERSQTFQGTVEITKPRDPLPPINASRSETDSSVESDSRRSSVPGPSKAKSANFKKLKDRKKRSSQAALEVEMETLALEDITKRSVSNLRKAQEYGSD